MSDLQQIAHQAKRHWGYPDLWIKQWREALTVSPDDLKTQRVFVAESGCRSVGFCSVKPVASGWSLEHMWVLPTFMKRGVGHTLLRAALEHVRSEGSRKLTIESDPNAEGFYVRNGATRIGRVAASVAGTGRYLPVLQINIS